MKRIVDIFLKKIFFQRNFKDQDKKMMDYTLVVPIICVVVVGCLAFYIIFQLEKQTSKINEHEKYIASRLHQPFHYMPPKANPEMQKPFTPVPTGVRDYSEMITKEAWQKFLVQ